MARRKVQGIAKIYFALSNFGREIMAAENFDDILNRAVRGIVEALKVIL